jgi:copper(I)-binding protein
MLMHLKHPLEQGKMVEATLQFEKAGTVKIKFPVATIGAAGPALPQATVTRWEVMAA